MKIKPRYILFLLIIIVGVFSFTKLSAQKEQAKKAVKDTIKKAIYVDTLKWSVKYKLKLHQTNAHASYYADKFNGRRTASGKRFDNNKYTAAHRKFPFGTKLKVTNESNNKSVIVEVTDRGPFSKGRHIDLTKRAFMEIASGKYGGSLRVKVEEIID